MNKIRLLAVFPLLYIFYKVVVPIASAAASEEKFVIYLQEGNMASLVRVFTLLGLLFFSMRLPGIYYTGSTWVLKFLGFREEEEEEEEEEV
ncbi:hypothetical protein LCGC14_2049050 [marine sediment metagenome]|uniref:Uncharacterized protein n=1 Tax=marine sediment metagenome TaxID=412755 RepID=A0A0F9EPP5_9ZZZZ